MTPPASQGFGYPGSMRGVWHHQDRRRRGPREVTGIVDLTRGKDHPTARLLDLVPGRSGTVYKNWLAERGQDLCAGCESRHWIPSRDSKNPIARPAPRTQPARVAPVPSSSSPVIPLMRYAVASSKTRRVTAGARVIPSIKSGFSCAPHAASSPLANKNDPMRPSRQMRRISVSKSPTTAPSRCRMSSTKPHPPTADPWPHTS